MHFFHGLTYFDEILQEADGVILSRGNLGIDLPPEKVFLFQKTVVFKCNMAGKPAVVTLVVDSMTENLRPPRAEATDVANAILDGSNAILLGAETLRGLYPVETFSTVGRICAEAFSLLNESPRIQTVVAALASDPNVWNAVWENKILSGIAPVTECKIRNMLQIMSLLEILTLRMQQFLQRSSQNYLTMKMKLETLKLGSWMSSITLSLLWLTW
nr:pyruvate kinase 1, cytosolic-like isoform X4 [Populus alba]